MPTIALFGINIAFAFTAWAVVTALYIWPQLRTRPRIEALRPLLVLNAFRFGGLAFLVPGVVSPDLPIAFARDAAFGDIIAAILALLSLATLHSRVGIFLVWVFNVWGTLDLLNAFYQGNAAGLQPGQLGAAYFIPTAFVPLLLITHGLIFAILLQRGRAPSRAPAQATASLAA
ncbi:MAG: hypothetical protein WA851_25485 [Xanthobacteraceae bacterium]